jgi:hypothetical protein
LAEAAAAPDLDSPNYLGWVSSTAHVVNFNITGTEGFSGADNPLRTPPTRGAGKREVLLQICLREPLPGTMNATEYQANSVPHL